MMLPDAPELSIARRTSNRSEDYIAIRVDLPDSRVQVEMPLADFARVVTGMTAVPVTVFRTDRFGRITEFKAAPPAGAVESPYAEKDTALRERYADELCISDSNDPTPSWEDILKAVEEKGMRTMRKLAASSCDAVVQTPHVTRDEQLIAQHLAASIRALDARKT